MLQARYFDGKTAAAQTVSLILDGQDLLLRGAEFELRWPLREVHISERLGNTPRLLAFAGGGHCEVTDHAALEVLLAPLGAKHSWLDGMHHSLAWALLAAGLIVLSLLAAYRYLLPWGAEVLAMRMPATVLQKMGDSTLETLDRFLLQSSKLDASRQQELRDAYARLQPLPDAQLQYRIEFRSSPEIGPNAFALPDGAIVMLDELVALSKDDNEFIAVLAHERGHVERRHALRMVLQSSVVGLVLAWYVGDVSSLLATAPAIIMQAKYSRDMEREADEYAVRTLRLNGLSPCLLTGILNKLEASHRATNKPNEPAPPGAKKIEVLDYLSSHPSTQERAALLCPRN
jgi:Zn-dependent protease with chaperone function